MTEINTGPLPVTVEIKYSLGHTYTFSYEKTEWHCPNCGEKKVWVEQGMGDYYEGPSHYCIGCTCVFTMPTAPSDAASEGGETSYSQVIEAIRATRYTV